MKPHRFARLMSRLPVIGTPLSRLLHRWRLFRGRPSGSVRYCAVEMHDVRNPSVTLCATETGRLSDWANRQTFDTVTLADGPPSEQGWFLAPGDAPPPTDPNWLWSAWIVAATESVQAVTLSNHPDHPPTLDSLMQPPWRSLTLFSGSGFTWDSERDTVRRRGTAPIVAKVIGAPGAEVSRTQTDPTDLRRRGPYLGDRTLPPTLTVGLARSLPVCGPAPESSRPGLLVTAPFLARGGAEHTLYETLACLRDRCRPAFATLAPHRPELDDRRVDFARLSSRLFSLGDWVHPDAMIPMLLHLIDSLGIDVLYNANGTTLFYDFAPRLKAARPGLRIIDHLYDHRVGYIGRYADPTLLDCIDTCIAENHPIAEILTGDFGWPPGRVPVLWSCGRPPGDLPAPENREAIRRSVREQLGYQPDDVVFLTAARMHEQKRPLDLVSLAARVADDPNLHFLVVGGGPMEAAVDRAIADHPEARIRRLAFRTDIPDLILAADVGLLVSEFEGLPVFLLECLQLGRPFLGTDVGDLGRVLRDTGAGPVVDTPGDLPALAEAARHLRNPEIRRALAAEAAAAGLKFSPEHCARAYGDVLFGSSGEPDR